MTMKPNLFDLTDVASHVPDHPCIDLDDPVVKPEPYGWSPFVIWNNI